MTIRTGLFISFEGGEGAGKSTLIESIYQRLLEHKIPVIKTREPGGSLLGEKIRELLLHQDQYAIGSMAEILLFLASRVQQIEEVIKPHLENGFVVLCDRYNDSTVAYQGIARKMGKDLTHNLCELACQGIIPNCTFYLDIDPKEGLKRTQKMNKNWDRLENQQLSFHQAVREGYLQLAKENQNRIHLLDATLPAETILEKAWKITNQQIKNIVS